MSQAIIFVVSWRKKPKVKDYYFIFRYFVLFNDGALLGYKSKPKEGFPEPLNDFMIKDAQTMCYDKPRPNMFMIRCLQWTTIIERTFYAESKEVKIDFIEIFSSVFIAFFNIWNILVYLIINFFKL